MKKPTVDDQKRLIEIDNQKYEVVNIPRTNKKVKVGWMKPHTFECVLNDIQHLLANMQHWLSLTVSKLTYFIIYIGGGYIT